MMILSQFFKNRMAGWTTLPAVLRRRLLVGGMLLLGVDCLYLIMTYEPVLVWFAYRFRSEDPLVHSDAIIVPLGSPGDRPTKAAELYRLGLAPVILMGQRGSASGEIEYHHQILTQNGVPAHAIEILPGEIVTSTYDEALRVRDYVRTHLVRRIIVVTTAFHTARTRWTFQRVLRGYDVRVRIAASQDPRFTESDWYTSDDGVRLYLCEVLKTLYYRLVY